MSKYKGPYSKINGMYGGVDDLGRVLSTDKTVPLPRANRRVGIFYYPAPGNHGLKGPYDNSKIVAAHPDATKSEEAWLAAGGGAPHVDHHWGERYIHIAFVPLCFRRVNYDFTIYQSKHNSTNWPIEWNI